MKLLQYGAAVELVLAESEGVPFTEAKDRAALFAGKSRRQIENWLNEPEFGDLVDELRAESMEALRERAVKIAVGNREARIRRRNTRWLQLGTLVGALGDHMTAAAERGEVDPEVVAAFDRFSKLELANEKQVAVELGQWSEKREIDLSKLSTAQLIALLEEAGSDPVADEDDEEEEDGE